MKIAFITHYWKNSEGGGIKIFLMNLFEALENLGDTVVVMYREGNDHKNYYCGRNKILFTLKSYIQLRKTCPEIIHSQNTWYCLLPGVIYKILNGCTLIHTFHTEPYKQQPLFFRYFFEWLLRKCDCITFVSKRLYERIIEVDKFKLQNIAITYAGVHIKEVPSCEINHFRNKYSIKEDSTVLLAQGMTAHHLKANGLKLLIQSISTLKNNHQNIKLIVTRQGKYSEELIEYVNGLGLEKHVIFTGDITNPYVPLSICDVYTHITLGDGLPLSLLEAMAMGKPIIATSIGGIPEVIDQRINGILIEPVVEQISSMIHFILTNQSYAESLGKCAKKSVKDNFTWVQAAERFRNCYSRQSENY